jgi:hypothetical protein
MNHLSIAADAGAFVPAAAHVSLSAAIPLGAVFSRGAFRALVWEIALRLIHAAPIATPVGLPIGAIKVLHAGGALASRVTEPMVPIPLSTSPFAASAFLALETLTFAPVGAPIAF